MSREEIITRLEEIASKSGFIYTLAILLRKDLFFNAEEAADIDWTTKISFQEFAVLTGLMIKHEIVVSYPTEQEVEDHINEIYKLFKELHQSHIQPMLEKMRKKLEAFKNGKPFEEDEKAEYDDMFGSGESMTEPMFYGGSGAYDFQHLELAVKKYARDSEWIKKNKGFSMETAVSITAFLKDHETNVARSWKKPKSFEEFCDLHLSVFSFSKGDLTGFNVEEVEAFLNAFSLTPGTVNQDYKEVGQYNVLSSHPIIVLGEDSYFLPVNFILTQSIYESPFYWLFGDKAYRDQASINRGAATEEIAFEVLQPVFGINLFKKIRIIRSRTEDATDIDILAVAGNKAIVFQAKSKRLTELSKRGSTEQLKKDFGEAVQKAYDQGLVCREAILSKGSKLTDSAGNEIKLEESIDDVYIVCLTSDEYPALTNQIEHYLTKAENNPSPVAMNLSDLDIVAFYLKDPFEFLYYLRQRTTTSDHFRASSEMAFLGFHLKQKLFQVPDNDRTVIDEGFAQLIDANFPVLRGHHPKTKAVERLYHKWKNDKFQKLIEQVKKTNDPGFTDAIFYLYDLSGDSADELIAQIEILLKKTKNDGKQHDFSMIFEKGKSGVSFMSSLPAEDMSERLSLLAMARKHKTKADLWLALGAYVGSENMIDIVGFNKIPWEFDQTLEDLSKDFLKTGTEMRWATRKKVGRNEKCPCGSDAKYKRCCGK